MSKKRLGLGIIVGAAAGLVAGILTAPKPGKETRADLQQKADELRGDAELKAEKLRLDAEAKIDDVTEKVRGRFK